MLELHFKKVLEESCGTLDTWKLEVAEWCPARAFLMEI